MSRFQAGVHSAAPGTAARALLARGELVDVDVSAAGVELEHDQAVVDAAGASVVIRAG